MVKQILLPILGVIAFITLVGFLVKNSGSLKIPGFPTPTPTASPQKTITVGSKSITVEVASSEPARELGLGGRSSLSPDSGMLFVFDKKGINPSFWMKGMLIPLDIIWIQGGSIIQINKNVAAPPAGASDASLKQFSAVKPIDYVLEVNGGFSDKNNIKVGSNVDLTGI